MSTRVVAGCIAVCLAAVANGAEVLDLQGKIRGDGSIVARDAKLERIVADVGFTESPAQAEDGSLYFSQLVANFLQPDQHPQAGHLWRFDAHTGKATIFRSPSGQSNGIAFDLQGRMVIAEGADFGGRRIVRTDLTTGMSIVLAHEYRGRPLNSPNDLVVDGKGRIYFTDPRYGGSEPIEQPVQGVYRIDLDGTVVLVAGDAGKPNGITISPDQTTLYVASLDNGSVGTPPAGVPIVLGPMALYAYDLHADGSLGARRVVLDFAPEPGPDGITVDRDGNLYLAIPGFTAASRGIKVISPQARELAFIPLPENPTNVKFGRGKDSSVLFITTAQSVYRLKVRSSGAPHESARGGGA